ncbi:MAG: hypothetical protein M9962_09210 [Oligoflexia bacterium]|nr:hypothetical protein [Oligoflexia bacterium]
MKNLKSKKNIISVLAIAFALLVSLPSFALTPEVQDLVRNETKSNAVSTRSDKAIAIEHFEIPLKLVENDISKRMPEEAAKALVFEKNGELHVRWIINPEDSKWHLELEKFLKEKGVDTTKHKYFTGYQTASRSYIVESPDGKVQMSLKVSTNKTGGNWTDKKQEAKDAFEVRKSTDYVMEQNAKQPFRNFIVMDEPASFGIKSIDQGMIVRLLAELPSGKFHYIPGFSAMHTEEGKRIAEVNGSKDVEKFWNENYNKPLARALAELAARTGVAYDSPHSQNFLIEMDAKLKPTGRIVLRDLGDIYLSKDVAVANGRADLAELWPRENLLSGKISAYVGIMHGNQMPSWLSETRYTEWGNVFYEEYAKEFEKVSGIKAETIRNMGHYQSGRYFAMEVNLQSAEMQDYLKKLSDAARTSGGSALTKCGSAFN